MFPFLFCLLPAFGLGLVCIKFYYRSEIQKFTIAGLAPSTRYLIYVAASLGNDKSLPYELVRIKTSHSCKHTKHHRVEKYGINGINWLERNNMIEDD